MIIYIVDTARWLANDDLNVVHNMMQINEKNELLYGHHHIQLQVDYYFLLQCIAMPVQI